MKIFSVLISKLFFVILIASCAAESEYIANLPKIDGFEVKKVYRLNRNMLAAYMDSSGNRLVFKLNESSATWKRILFKTKVSFNYEGWQNFRASSASLEYLPKYISAISTKKNNLVTVGSLVGEIIQFSNTIDVSQTESTSLVPSLLFQFDAISGSLTELNTVYWYLNTFLNENLFNICLIRFRISYYRGVFSLAVVSGYEA